LAGTSVVLARTEERSGEPAGEPRARLQRWKAAAKLIRDLVRIHPRPFITAVSGSALFALCTVASAIALQWTTDHVIDPRFRDGHVATHTVVTALAVIVGIGVIRAVGVVVRRRWAGIARWRIAESLGSSVVDKLVAQPPSWHQGRSSGDVAARAGVDVDAAVEVLSPLPFATGVVLLVFVSSLWMLYIDLPLGLLAVAVFPILISINIVYQHRVDRHYTAAQSHLGDLSAAVTESFEGVQVVKAFGAEARETERLSTIASRLREERMSAVLMKGTFDSILDAIPALANVALVLAGAYRIRSGAITIGDLASMVYMFTLLVLPLRLIGFALSALPHSLAGWLRVREVLDEPLHADPAESLLIAPPGTGLTLDDVSYAFEAGRPVLAGINLSIPGGTTVAVVGTTGSGKTTLLRLAAGLVAPDAGTVAVAAGQRAIVLQEAFLIGASLRENIVFAGTFGDDEVWAALEAAQGRDFVEELPTMLDTEVGERGVSLSGGQRQRVALARALVRRPALLLLDDTTSALDPATEARVVASLRSTLADSTVLIVASRPSTIALADSVIFLNEQRIEATGSHLELLRSNDRYRSIMEAFEADRETEAGAATGGGG
jgi:ABC-type multidrug transport system fused ATPase/permease subunit